MIAPKWKMRRGLTYKDFCNGTLEINPGFPISRGWYYPGGRGGDGIKADGGDGIKADGSDLTGSKKAWLSHDIRPGMIYKNEPILGFILENRLNAAAPTLHLPATEESLKLMDLLKDRYSLKKVVKEESSLLDVFFT